MQRPIYLDYAATTPVDPRVAELMCRYLTLEGDFGNPASSTHIYGAIAKEAIDTARQHVADLIGASTSEIIWTSGATEANNLAIKGAAYFHQHKKNHIITVKTEHKSVLDPCYALAEQGFNIDFLNVNAQGFIDLTELAEKITDNTLMVSVMHVNNELGIIQDIASIGKIAHAKNSLLHVDAAQSAGRVAIHVENMQIDLLSLSGHKMYGPKGVGALYVRRKPRARIQPLMHGGGHEQGLRPGTLATHQIVGMGEAARLLQQEMSAEMVRLQLLRDRLWQQLQGLPGVTLNTDLAHAAGNYLNFSVAGVDGEMLLQAIASLAVSLGSACNSAQFTPSHVLKAIGVSDALAQSSLRLSLGRFTTPEDIETAGAVISQACYGIIRPKE